MTTRRSKAYVMHFYKHDPAINGRRTAAPGHLAGRKLANYTTLRNSDF